MDSTLLGIHRLYSLKEMNFSSETVELVATQTCKLGLSLLSSRYEYCKGRFNYSEIDDNLINMLKTEYNDSYRLLKDMSKWH